MKLLKPIMLILLTAALGAIVVLRSHLDKPITAIEEQNSISAGNSGYSQILQINSKQESDEAVDNTNLKTGENAFSSFVVSDNEYENIVSSRTAALDMGEIEILFDGNPLFCCNDGTWFYSLVEDSETAYNPEVTVSGSVDTLKIAIKEFEITPENIEDNSHAQFVVYNDIQYFEYLLVITTLPIINIDTSIPTDDIMRARNEKMSITVFDNRGDITDRLAESNGYIHLRGAHSLEYPQRSFRISLRNDSDEKVKFPLIGLRNDDDFILTTTYSDQEKLRSVFTANLWYETVADDNYFSVALGPEYKYVELIMNGDYRGLYGLSYPLDSKQVDLKENEYIYKKNKASYNQQTNPEIKGAVTSFEIKDMGKGSIEDTSSNWQPLREYLYIVEGLNTNEIYESVDIENHIDAFLFVNLVAGIDNMKKNQIFVSKLLGDKRITLTAVWDLDETWGNCYSSTSKHHIGVYEIPYDYPCIVENNAAVSLLKAKDDNIIELIQKRYLNLRTSKWSNDNIMSMIDLSEEKIFSSGAYKRSIERWPNGKYLESESTKLNDFRAYVTARLAYMDDYVENLTF